jgi:GxxExxY protein
MSMKEVCDVVRQTAFAVHRYLGPGHLEKVYERALTHRLQKIGLRVRPQHPISVFDEDGTLIGEYFADVLINDDLLVELKSALTLGPEHEAQVLGYLRASNVEHGLLINFGGYRFQIRKYARINGRARES